MLAGLAVPDKVAALLAEPQQVLGVSSADGSVIPSGEKREGQNPEICSSLGRLGPSEGSCCFPGSLIQGRHVCAWVQSPHRRLPSARCLPGPGERTANKPTHGRLLCEAEVLEQVLWRR